MGAVVFAAIAVPQLPDEPSDLLVVVYAGLGIAAGLLASYLLVYLWNVAWAAARQRNEAWMDLDAATVAAQKRDSYERALAVLSGYAQLGALILEEIYDCFQVSPL